MKRNLLSLLLVLAIAICPNYVKADADKLPDAVDGVITLSENVNLLEKLTLRDDVTINLNGYVLKFNTGDNHFYGDVIIDNGTLDVSGVTHSADGILEVGNYGNVTGGLTLKNVKLQGEDYGSSYAVIYVYSTSELNIIDSELVFKNESSSLGGVIKSAQGTLAKINIINSTLDFTDTVRGLQDGTMLIKDSTVKIRGEKENGLDNAINTSAQGLALTIDNSTIEIENAVGRGITLDNTTLIIKNGSNITMSNCQEGEIMAKEAGGNIMSDNRSVIDAVITQRPNATVGLTVSGGIHTNVVDENFLSDSFELVENADGTYSVAKKIQTFKVEGYKLENKVNLVIDFTKETEKIISDSLISNEELYNNIVTSDVNVTVKFNQLEESNLDEMMIKSFKDMVNNAIIAAYFDVSIDVINAIDNSFIGNIDELTGEIEVKILLSEELINNNKDINRIYYVIREHNNQVELLEVNISEDGQYLVFKTDKFSTYAVGYTDEEIKEEVKEEIKEDVKEENEEIMPPATFDGIVKYVVFGIMAVVSLIIISIMKKKESFN